MTEFAEQIAELLRETARAHHAALAEEEGHDPEWPLWYADYLRERLAAIAGRRFTQSELVRILMNLEDARAAEAPDTEWAEFYAKRLAGFDDGAAHVREAGRAEVTGIGGIFFKARDPDALKAWYREHLGVEPLEDGTVVFQWREHDDPEQTGYTVWGPFRESTTYFAPSEKPFMFNFRVTDLDAIRERLRAAGVAVDDKVEEYAYGRFGWCMDPEGNRIEFWEPR